MTSAITPVFFKTLFLRYRQNSYLLRVFQCSYNNFNYTATSSGATHSFGLIRNFFSFLTTVKYFLCILKCKRFCRVTTLFFVPHLKHSYMKRPIFKSWEMWRKNGVNKCAISRNETNCDTIFTKFKVVKTAASFIGKVTNCRTKEAIGIVEKVWRGCSGH